LSVHGRHAAPRRSRRAHEPVTAPHGDVAFDSRDDVLAPGVTVLRVLGGGSVAGGFATVQGAAVERVETVDPALIR
jgi:hypothetical protein